MRSWIVKRISMPVGENGRGQRQTGKEMAPASGRTSSLRYAAGLLALLLLISLTVMGYAQSGTGTLGGRETATSKAYELPSVAPLTPVTPAPTFYHEVAPLTPITPEPAFYPEIVPLKPITPTPVPTSTPQSTPGLADWVLSVDDNATLSFDSITQYVNLYVSMNKSGGRDVTGTYNGKILYTSATDEADLARLIESSTDASFVAGYMNYTMEAVSASIEVVKFNEQACIDLWGSVPAKADYMAIATVDLSMRLQSHISTQTYMGQGESWAYEDEEIIIPAEICFLITGGQVQAYIGVHPEEKAFSGLLVGTLQ